MFIKRIFYDFIIIDMKLNNTIECDWDSKLASRRSGAEITERRVFAVHCAQVIQLWKELATNISRPFDVIAKQEFFVRSKSFGQYFLQTLKKYKKNNFRWPWWIWNLRFSFWLWCRMCRWSWWWGNRFGNFSSTRHPSHRHSTYQ